MLTSPCYLCYSSIITKPKHGASDIFFLCLSFCALKSYVMTVCSRYKLFTNGAISNKRSFLCAGFVFHAYFYLVLLFTCT